MASILRSCHAECQRKCAMLRCFNKSARKSSPCSERSGCERDKIRPARLAVVKNETKFALHAQNMRKSGIPSELGEFCTEYEVSRFLLGEFFTELLLDGPYWARFFAPTGTAPRSWRRRGALHVGTGGGLPPARPLCTVSPACRTLVLCNSPLRSAASVCVRAGFPRVLLVRRISVAMLTARGHNKTARRAAGRGWSGRRESNPPLKLGKLPFYR